MDDIKIFPKNEKELEILAQIISIYSQNTGKELGIEKYARFAMEKRETIE